MECGKPNSSGVGEIRLESSLESRGGEDALQRGRVQGGRMREIASRLSSLTEGVGMTTITKPPELAIV
jgi:hypothetical protein